MYTDFKLKSFIPLPRDLAVMMLTYLILLLHKKIKSYAAIPVHKKYHIILTHAGFVGVNHYQAAKGAALCAPIIKDNGICILAAHHTDLDPIGGKNYKKMMEFPVLCSLL